MGADITCKKKIYTLWIAPVEHYKVRDRGVSSKGISQDNFQGDKVNTKYIFYDLYFCVILAFMFDVVCQLPSLPLRMTQGVARILKKKKGGGGANNHDYITIIMLKVLQWMNEF